MRPAEAGIIQRDVSYHEPEIEALDRDGIVAIQRRKLVALGSRLANSEDWVRHFARAGMHPSDLGDPAKFRTVPMLEKRDLRERYPFPFLTAPMEDVARF